LSQGFCIKVGSLHSMAVLARPPARQHSELDA
jgi:hypothetical protein